MRKITAVILTLLMLCSFTLPVLATGVFTVTFHNGTAVEATREGVTECVLPAPASVPSGKVFAGWRATTDEGTVFLPAGATYVPLADTAFHAVFVGMAVRVGANLRLLGGDETGLRFMTDVVKADYDALAQLDGDIEKGTIIAPLSYVEDANGVLTVEALAAAGHTKYLDAVAGDWYRETADTYTLAGSIRQIKPANYTRKFVAVGYLGVTYTNGESARIYAPTVTDAARDVYNMAISAYNDRAAATGDKYCYAVGDGSWSPYTTEQLNTVRLWIDGIVKISFNTNEMPYLLSCGDYYTAPYTVSYNISTQYISVTVKSGSSFNFNTHFAEAYVSGSRSGSPRLSEDGLVLKIRYVGGWSGFY